MINDSTQFDQQRADEAKNCANALIRFCVRAELVAFFSSLYAYFYQDCEFLMYPFISVNFSSGKDCFTAVRGP